MPMAGARVAGVDLPGSVTVAGRTLQLNGAGVRTRFFVKVYAIGLYLERVTADAGAVLAADETRHVELRLLRSLSADDITSAIVTAVEESAGDALPTLRSRLDRLRTMFRPAAAGESITLDYVPGTGTAISANGEPLGTLEGKDLADVLLSVWIGPAPLDAGLKRALLGGA
jgi:Chalcone isomerase-like